VTLSELRVKISNLKFSKRDKSNNGSALKSQKQAYKYNKKWIAVPQKRVQWDGLNYF